MSLFFGLLSALGFGTGDFLAGLASRKTPAIVVSFYSQLTALAVVAGVTVLFAGTPTFSELGWGAAAGIAIGSGLVRYYHGLSTGSMGMVATVAAVFSAAVPFAAGLAMGEHPTRIAIAGVVASIAALILITGRGKSLPGLPLSVPRAWSDSPAPPRDPHPFPGLADGVAAGTCFGFSFVFLGLATTENPLWPVSATLAGSLIPLLPLHFAVSRARRKTGTIRRVVVAAGLCHGLALLAFGLAVIEGLISIVSVAAALSPVPTALLALVVLGERLSRRQVLGLMVALVGITLLVLG